MKNKHFYAIILVICLLFSFCLTIFGYENKVSPAIDILANQLNLVKTGLISNEITFTAKDFDNALGVKKVNEITIASLPPVTDGILKLGSLDVMEQQTIERKNFEQLHFIPTSNSVLTSSFSFYSGTSSYDVTCTLYVLSEMNFAPTLSLINERSKQIATQKNISVYGTLKASDPENDALEFVITKEPKKGMLTVTDKHYGNYKYTPASGYSGKDSFQYVAYDKYGNCSENATVSIQIEKPLTTIVYSDMQDHWAHNAAIKMAANNIMVGEKIGNDMVFHPEEPVSRCEFLAMAMNTAGMTEIAATINTGFLDDRDIPAHLKGYVATAAQMGIINGCETEAGYYFYPNYQITRAEAAVILNNILDAKQPVIKPVFADTSVVPAWAENAIYALCEIGVLNGTGEGYISPYSPINRAQTAQMLATVLEIN